jgi:hypothetical protein
MKEMTIQLIKIPLTFMLFLLLCYRITSNPADGYLLRLKQTCSHNKLTLKLLSACLLHDHVTVVPTVPVHRSMFLLLIMKLGEQLSSSDDACAKQSGSSRFESGPRHWLSWLSFPCLPSLPKRISLPAAWLLLACASCLVVACVAYSQTLKKEAVLLFKHR